MEKYEAWIKQAQNDLLWGKDSLKNKYYSQTCFIAQQIGEKALKAVAYFRGVDFVKSHSIVNIAKDLKINGSILKAGRVLDLYYISGRYPDGLPDLGVPSDYFSEEQAVEAVELAETILQECLKELNQ